MDKSTERMNRIKKEVAKLTKTAEKLLKNEYPDADSAEIKKTAKNWVLEIVMRELNEADYLKKR